MQLYPYTNLADSFHRDYERRAERHRIVSALLHARHPRAS